MQVLLRVGQLLVRLVQLLVRLPVVRLLVRVEAAVVQAAFCLWRGANFCVLRGRLRTACWSRPFRGFAWQAQHLVTPVSVLGESVWSGVAGRFGVFPRGVLRSRVLRFGSWLGRAT